MIGLELFVVFVTALAITFASIPLIRRFADAYGLYDNPDAGCESGATLRRVHVKPIPRLGGVGIVFGAIASMGFWVNSRPLFPIYGASLLMFAVGLFDDLKPLPAKARLLVQIVAASIAILSSHLYLESINLAPSFAITVPAFLGFIISLFIVVGSINATNLIDGLDGLAGGLVLIGMTLLSMLHFLATGNLELLLCMTIPVVGSLIGFLRYNTHPASIFMGDGGSNWLGFMIGISILTVLTGTVFFDSGNGIALVKGTKAVTFISALMCFAVPIVDTAVVIIIRLSKGVSPMMADRNHFHHSLMNIGLSHPQSVGTIYFLALVMGMTGLMPIAYPEYDFWWAPYLAGCFLLFTVGITLTSPSRFLFPKIKAIFAAKSVNPIQKRRYRWLIAVSDLLVRYGIYCILALAPLLAGVPPRSIGFAAVACFMLMFLTFFVKESHSFFNSLVLSISSSVLLTANNMNVLYLEIFGMRYSVQFMYNTVFVGLFCMSLFYLFITFRRRSLLITPTDFLMLGLPLFYLFVPEPYRTTYKLNIISLRSLVLFIAIRTLTRQNPGFIRRVRTVSIFAVAYVVLVSLFGLRIIY